MKIIGLTGGIACGKSTVSAYLKQKGAFIIDGDAIARQLSEPKKSIWQAYVNHFGDKVLNADNSLNIVQVLSTRGDLIEPRTVSVESDPLLGENTGSRFHGH